MIALGFYTLSVIILLLLLVIFGHYKEVLLKYLLIISIWLIYTATLSLTGFLYDFGLPPRLPLLIVIPAIFLSVFLTGRSSFQPILSHTAYYLPILLQSFRIIVELLIFGAYQNDVFPQLATFEGLNFDILVGISALPMSWLVYKNVIGSRSMLIWNIASLMVLSLTAFTFIYSFYFTAYQQTSGAREFSQFPYILLASVLLPTAIFLHVFSLRQVHLLSKGD